MTTELVHIVEVRKGIYEDAYTLNIAAFERREDAEAHMQKLEELEAVERVSRKDWKLDQSYSISSVPFTRAKVECL